MADGFKIVTDCWPLVVSTAPARIDEDSMKAFFDTHNGLIARRERYVALTDLTALTHIPDAALRKKIAGWTKEMEGEVRRYNIGSSAVIASSLVRGALTAVHWVVPPPSPMLVVAHPLEGLRFLLGILEKNGIAVTPAMQRYRDAVAARAGGREADRRA